MMEWIALYKFLRLAVLAIGLAGIAWFLFHPSRRDRLEEPALRMLEEPLLETPARETSASEGEDE